METINKFCPSCHREQPFEKVVECTSVHIREEYIPVNIISWKCPLCGEAFEDNETDFMEDAFREYRKRKGYLQPEEIKAFRKHLKLSQNEFGNLVGIGLASVNRYENGGLQSEAAEKALRFVMQKYSDQIIENPYSGITP